MDIELYKQDRDAYYSFLKKKYGITDHQELISVINEPENKHREYLELRAMGMI